MAKFKISSPTDEKAARRSIRCSVHGGRDLGINFKHSAPKSRNFGVNFKATLKPTAPMQFKAHDRPPQLAAQINVSQPQ
nr:hypothetical protein [uncultured Campylobacter sp.]